MCNGTSLDPPVNPRQYPVDSPRGHYPLSPTMTDTYDLSIPDEYGSYDTYSFDSVYDAQESLLDALDRVASPGSGWQLRALLEEVEADIRAMEEPEE